MFGNNNNKKSYTPLEITSVAEDSPADSAGIRPGDYLLAVNGRPVNDVLDYKFYTTARKLTLKLRSGTARIKKDEYEDVGLEFGTYLMSEKQRCKNNCIFCFIDQMPKKMRPSLYFKDDDARLSFLQGNYITLTNLTDGDVERIIKMKLNVNISVHTVNPELRCKMLRNPHAGEKLAYLYKMARAGISINCQLVLCKGINDGDELRRSLETLCALYPSAASIACVPAGLTKWRDNLPELELFDKQDAEKIIDTIEEFGDKCFAEHGDRLVYPSDELFLLAEREIPDYDYYGGYLQYENGVGMERLLEDEFMQALEEQREASAELAFSECSIATGVLAAPLIEKLLKAAGANVNVYAVKNKFFGETITVAGLVTGGDLIEQLTPHNDKLGKKLLIPETMLRAGEKVFLDDVTVGDVQQALGLEVITVECHGAKLLEALLR